VSALALDIKTYRRVSQRGMYNAMADSKLAFNADPHMDDVHDRETIGLEYPEYTHANDKSFRMQKPIEASRFGYSIPEEQTSYDGPGAP
jgi:hypothetical protein